MNYIQLRLKEIADKQDVFFKISSNERFGVA
jgi:hypothetical protein